MKILLLPILLLITISSCKQQNSPRQRLNFNRNWKFCLSDDSIFSQESFQDSDWRIVKLPHDWSIEGKFDSINPATPSGGALPGGIAWYRKHFVIAAKDSAKSIFIDFDGIYRNSSVYINGHLLGIRPYGYSSFCYQLNPYLHYNRPNTLAVRVDNSKQPNCRWYTGSGIYRNVWLRITNPTHIAHWGTFIRTKSTNKKIAVLEIETTITQKAKQSLPLQLITFALSPQGDKTPINKRTILPNDSLNITVHQNLKIYSPTLWSIDHPDRYILISRLYANKKLIDEYQTPFGIRTFKFDDKTGFYLNHQPLKIKGVCLHNDWGCLGTAINKHAIIRRLLLLKKMGCNSIRTSHNPPSPELLNLCDQMGFLVMDETFDGWRKKKTTYDYSINFPQWYQQDLTDHILRDRNHPSVFIWSIGNEVLEQWANAKADTLNPMEANLLLNLSPKNTKYKAADRLNVDVLLCRHMAELVKQLDPSRPVCSANNNPNSDNTIFRSGAMDIIGFNYHTKEIANVPKNFPEKPFICTESTSALMTRGYYQLPSDSVFLWPTRWDIPFLHSPMACSSYDNCHTPWGNSHETAWKVVRDNKFVSGLFVWTGFDYLGEPTPFWWPARSSYFGILDLAGLPKDIYYFYKSEWSNQTVLHLFPHWNWRRGQIVDIWAYYNHADEVELYVNGKSVGIRRKNDSTLHVMWRVPFDPGQIKAVSRKGGKIIKTTIIKTAGKPAKIQLHANRKLLDHSGDDLSYITIQITDKNGNPVPYASNEIEFSIQGDASIEGVNNGDPTSHESLKGQQISAFHGKCILVVRAGTTKGKITVKAYSKSLIAAQTHLFIQ